MAAQAVRHPSARNSNSYILFHIADHTNGRSACNRGRLELRSASMVPAESVPWGKRCRRGGCNRVWLEIPDHSGEPPIDPEEYRAPRRAHHGQRRAVVAADVMPTAMVEAARRPLSPLSWRLELICGHVMYRTVQYSLSPSASSRVVRRSVEERRPAPGFSRCDFCR